MNGRNLIILVLIIETLFISLSVAFLVFYYENLSTLSNHDPLFFALALVVISAAESAVMLALIARIYRKSGTIMVRKDNEDEERKH